MFSNAHALVVGIAHYPHQRPLPEIVLKDAQDIHALLVDPHACGYLPANVELCLDEAATQTGLRDALARLAARVAPGDTALLYFSCHGDRVMTETGVKEFLLPFDADEHPNSALSGEELTEALGAINAQKLVVLFDCCHAAGVGHLKSSSAPAGPSGFSTNYYAALARGRGRVILAASRGDEPSLILPSATNSLFTQYVLDGLRGAAASGGVVHIFKLVEYVQTRVVAASNGQQHPVFESRMEDNFAVALHPDTTLAPPAEFEFDAYISYASADGEWVWKTLVPRLAQANLRVAVSGDVEEAGAYRVVGAQHAVERSKRVVLVLSEASLEDRWAELHGALSQDLGVDEGTHRLLPIKIAPLSPTAIPLRLRALVMLDFTDSYRRERNFERLITSLSGPLPSSKMG